MNSTETDQIKIKLTTTRTILTEDTANKSQIFQCKIVILEKKREWKRERERKDKSKAESNQGTIGRK